MASGRLIRSNHFFPLQRFCTPTPGYLLYTNCFQITPLPDISTFLNLQFLLIMNPREAHSILRSFCGCSLCHLATWNRCIIHFLSLGLLFSRHSPLTKVYVFVCYFCQLCRAGTLVNGGNLFPNCSNRT